MNNEERCATCKFFSGRNTPFGSCQRNAPVHDPMRGHATFAAVSSTTWCGEWKRNEAPAAPVQPKFSSDDVAEILAALDRLRVGPTKKVKA